MLFKCIRFFIGHEEKLQLNEFLKAMLSTNKNTMEV